jgi:hypothetical protein
MSEPEVREAFAKQAAICTAAGAPFTGRVCRLIGARLDRSGSIGRRVLDWPGNPSHEGDALPLRFAGGLHDLARSGVDPDLTAIYPPNVAPEDDDVVWAVLSGAIAVHAEALDPWLDGPPQTNEVGRSAGLMAGLLVLAERFGLPFDLYELGASAGLNSLLDRYGYDLGGVMAGDPASAVQLKPVWTGAPPPEATVRVQTRQAVDRNPLDVSDPGTRRMLSAYVWTDQRERLARLNAALDLAVEDPVAVAREDAADWLEARLAVAPPDGSMAGVCRVVMHTIAFQYFPPEVQARIRAHMAAVGARATAEAPLAWLTFEAEEDGFERRPMLRLRTWPGEDEAIALARGQPHGARYDWLLSAAG